MSRVCLVQWWRSLEATYDQHATVSVIRLFEMKVVALASDFLAPDVPMFFHPKLHLAHSRLLHVDVGVQEYEPASFPTILAG